MSALASPEKVCANPDCGKAFFANPDHKEFCQIPCRHHAAYLRRRKQVAS